MMPGAWIALVFAIVVLIPTSAAARDCDPHREGLFENLGCEEAWDRRLRARVRTLERLRAEYRSLAAQNASLARRTAALRQLIRALREENARIEATLQQLRTVQIGERNLHAVLTTIQQQADRLDWQLTVLLEMNPACLGPDSVRTRQSLVTQRQAAREIAEDVSIGAQILSTIGQIAELFPAGRVVKFLMSLGRIANYVGTTASIVEMALGNPVTGTQQTANCG